MDIQNVSELFAEVARQSGQLIVAYDDVEKSFFYSNPAFKELCVTYAIDCSSPAAFFKAIHPEDSPDVENAYARFLAGEQISPLEFRLTRPAGDVVWLCATPHRTVIKGHQILFIEASDITSAKDNAAVLNKFASKKNAILHILSHDLAGPLGIIRNLAALLGEKLHAEASQEVIKLVKTIEAINNQNINLLNDFLNKEFLESAQVEVVKARVDLVKVIADIVVQYQNMAEQVRKTFRFTTALDTLPISLDAPKFQQVINNLIWNAIKFTREPGGEITISLTRMSDHVLISVTDNGIGIPEKFHDVLFEEFTPARRPGLKGEPTIGLGMHIIKTIVEWHDGSVRFESKENEGSTFYIELPLTWSAAFQQLMLDGKVDQ